MEEFEHMIVEEFNEEDFYENIEAPKFVDLTAPDHRPEGDDRYWFCSRVGCDQKHEEFMDSEAIYKNFVLRVMAARSPSVRLRKALYRKDFSVEPKCPNTVPAKPSRSRVSRLAMISSIPHKANNLRSKEVKAIPTSKIATPKTKAVKGKESSSVPHKALTERKKKQMQSPAAFRSVQHPRPAAATRATESRVVAKALVFGSPKKLVKLKRSVELSSSVKKLCSGMRKLEVGSKRKGLGVNNKVEASTTPSKKPLRTREMKSRVFDSVLSQKKQVGEKVKGSATLKKRVKEKKEPVVSSDPSKAHEAKGKEHENQFLVENKSEENASENALALDCDDKENATIVTVDREDTCVLDKVKQSGETTETEDKENVANASDVDAENDDKENASALDNNRKVDQSPSPMVKRKVFGRKETCKTTPKAMTIADKCFNGKTVSANPTVKYTKPKLTNPKPFRLRTDERRILKEANAEKKPQCALAKEEETTNILGVHAEKHQTVRLEKNTTSRVKASRGTSTTLVRDDASGDMVTSKRVASGTKKQVAASKRVVTMEETSLMNGESKEAAIINNKPSVCAVASGEKRHATVPKGPNFHSIHVPKSCTKRVASHV
ncbi:BnaA01g18040D [Brassica napus]|uniref:(rape) hypothetical protein n=1 Tax=Brassica napus TaxID=3708 RepID=A0A078HWX0_BRANA|nr:uncharacterized protein LOC106425374 [Brassica napus]CAF2150630.1 unnamed protein product [Brassica napus]CDY42950.1 BnaA01g18040D [Brassica napus]